jgi:transposase-like protein
MKTITTPKTFLEAVTYFSSEVVCVEFLSNLKWGGAEKCCTRCGSTAVYGLRTRPVFKCRDCKKQFSMKKDTIMEKSPLPMSKWLPVLWMVVNDKNGVSSYEVARGIGVSQQTAWFMTHRCREAIQNGSLVKLKGEVEIDETYVGGAAKFMHKKRKAEKLITPSHSGKTVVMGMVERKGEVRAKVVDSAKRRNLLPHVWENIEKGSKVYTDKLRSYDVLGEHYDHSSVDHMKTYVDGDTHTNTLENFWMLFKRSVKGTYVHIAPYHTDRYLDEQIFRYNNRKDTDSGRFEKAALGIFGKRLTYAELTGVVRQ